MSLILFKVSPKGARGSLVPRDQLSLALRGLGSRRCAAREADRARDRRQIPTS